MGYNGDLGKHKETSDDPRWGGRTTSRDTQGVNGYKPPNIHSTGDNWKRSTFRSGWGWANKKEGKDVTISNYYKSNINLLDNMFSWLINSTFFISSINTKLMISKI